MNEATTLDLLRRLREFAQHTEVDWNGTRRSWANHVAGNGHADEERLVQPHVFRSFAAAFLGFTVGVDLAAEQTDRGSRPDFTPADLVTHRFVFECKGSNDPLTGHGAQVRTYLTTTVRTHYVVLINMVQVRVFELDSRGEPVEVYAVNLRALFSVAPEVAATLPESDRFARFVREFSRVVLSKTEKVERVRKAPAWNPIFEITDSDWLVGRISNVISAVQAEVERRVASGALLDQAYVTADERLAIEDELRQILIRFGHAAERVEKVKLAGFLTAQPGTDEQRALGQFCAHVAYWLTTKLVLVRVWEDLTLIDPASLYDGGFDIAMQRQGERIGRVLTEAFASAGDHYRALFASRPTYSWFEPSEDLAVDVVYELATTYFGAVKSDVLGEVYERMLERIDRKLLGQYYTPRDVIRSIWDLVLTEAVLDESEAAGRSPIILDIATGSGGFLVEAAARLRVRAETQIKAGAGMNRRQWINALAEGLNGVEFQRFSAFLAELNLLIQFSQFLAQDPSLRLPELGIVPGDTLSLHSAPRQSELLPVEPTMVDEEALLPGGQERRQRARRIKDAPDHAQPFDVVVGNPPYIGESLGSAIMQRTREAYPYWESFVAPHLDYLYWFLILGVSKLRAGGRFGFITTEYWLRARGATKLREYIGAEACIERIILFREMRLFPTLRANIRWW